MNALMHSLVVTPCRTEMYLDALPALFLHNFQSLETQDDCQTVLKWF